jgi:photosynthetic reaction center cytochrome c subunit
MNPVRTAIALGAAALLLAACERPPITTVQIGYRGTGMEQNINPRLLAEKMEANQVPEAQPAIPAGGPKAGEVYKNVPVLGGLDAGEFTRLMVAITQWVSPEQGCTYCHKEGEDLSSDSLYTKVVARKMFQMTQHVNQTWKKHVGDTGVTCYTCHRGQPVPSEIWFAPQQRKHYADSLLGNPAGQNIAAKSVGYSSLPNDPFSDYLLGDKPIRVNGNEALAMEGAAANRKSSKQAEFTYGLMMHMSGALGVNCTYCHNTRAFQSWSEAPPPRATAWHGIRMARDLNNAYMVPLTDTFPAASKGPLGDVPKLNCATCHQGVNKPLYGQAMLKDYQALAAPVAAYVKAAAPEPLPAPIAEASRAVMYFNTGSAALEATQAGSIAQLVEQLAKNPKTRATISGYHSASGTLEANQELAKQRAIAVLDALKAAGVAEARVALEKPQQTSGNVAGEDPEARRVEVNVK